MRCTANKCDYILCIQKKKKIYSLMIVPRIYVTIFLCICDIPEDFYDMPEDICDIPEGVLFVFFVFFVLFNSNNLELG